MYLSFQIAIKYFHYWITASNGRGHGIHSPFVYQMVNEVFHNKEQDDFFKKIESLRKELLLNHHAVEVEDFGAGSVSGNKRQRKIKDIARYSLKSPKYARLMFQLAQFIKAENIIELGTSLGITTAYLAASNPKAQVRTFEGASAVASIAAEHFEKLSLPNIRLYQGEFDDRLEYYKNEMLPSHDLIYIDGNHTYEATLRYFHFFLPLTNEHTLMVFDDIHWSDGMERAWEAIKQHPAVTLTIDLFFVGLVFFRKSQLVSQHFKIRY
jgi:predicted O-methyltransferase YrrM